MKDWGTYVKLFNFPAPDFERLPFMTRAVAAELTRRVDRMGRLVPGERVSPALIADVAFVVRAHPGEHPAIREAIELLLNDGYLVFECGYLTIRNYVKAQRSSSADRMAAKRERDGAASPPPVDSSDRCDASDVTGVTSGRSDQIRSDQIQPPLVPPPGGESAPAEPKPRPKRRTAKVPLPEAWAPNDRHRAKASELGVSCATEAEKFRNHALGKDTRWADWDRAFANWLANAAVLAPRGPVGSPGAGGTPADREQAERDGKLVAEIRAGGWGDRASKWLQHSEHRGVPPNLRQFREWIDQRKVQREKPPPKARDSPPAEVIELAAGVGRRIP